MTSTSLMNVCLDIFGSFPSVFTQSCSDWGMQIVAQIQVKILFVILFS